MDLLLLILGPMAAALLALVGGRRLRTLAVVAAAVSLLTGAGFAFSRGGAAATLPAVFHGVPLFRLPALLDALLLLYIARAGWRVGRGVITFLALAQLACVFSLELGAHPEVAVFRTDALSLVMVFIISAVGSSVALFSLPYMREHESHFPEAASTNVFFAILLAFLGVMNGLVLADSLHWVGLGWEATTLASFLLISHNRTTESVANAARALTVNSLGGLAFALATVIAARGGEPTLSRLIAGHTGSLLPVGLLLFAAFAKAALYPFQIWLTGAMVAPTPVSALLHSSTMVKAAVYLVLRLAPAFRGTPLAVGVALYGAFAFFAASATAIGQVNGKKVLAYSTIANLGLMVSCAGVGTTAAIASAVLLVLFHAATKALLFLCVGTIEHGIGTRNIEEMEGVFWKMPVTTLVAVLAMLAMVLPPFGMLTGKWLAIESSVGMPFVLALTILGSALTLVFWAKWIGKILIGSYHRRFHWEPLPILMRLPELALLAAVTAGSVGVAPLFNWLVRPVIVDQFAMGGFVRTGGGGLETGIGGFLPWPMFLVIAAILLALLAAILSVRPEDVRPPFLCGENADLKPGTSFFTARDAIEHSETGNYYLETIFGEGAVMTWANPLAVALLLAMAGLIW